jgi:hypothetical protein
MSTDWPGQSKSISLCLRRDEEVLHVLELQGGQRIMDGYRPRDAGPSSRVEGTRRQTDDVIRRQASSLDQPMKRPSLHEIEIARAIDRGKYKMQKYQQETEHYRSEERDTFEEFEKNFKSTLTNLEDCVVEVASINSSGDYTNEIDVKNGRILGGINRCEHPDSEERLDFSEIIFNQLRLAMKHLDMKMPEFNLKCWYGDTITNEETKKTANLFFPEEIGEDGLAKEGERNFLAGTDAFTALAGTPTAQSKFFLLAQHPKAFKDKKVTSITVIRQVYSIIDINYEFGS